MPIRMARSARYLFVTHESKAGLSAFDMTQELLPSAWGRALEHNPAGVAVALRDSVLIVAFHEAKAVVPVDIRAVNPIDWRYGAQFDAKVLTAGPAAAFRPMDMAYADGRLFVTSGEANAVRIFEVAMDPTASAAPIRTEGAPLITLNPIAVVTARALHMRSVYAVTTAPSERETGGVRVFVGSWKNDETAELTAEGRFVRRVRIDADVGASCTQALTVAGGRLFAALPKSVKALSISRVPQPQPQRQLNAWQQLGSVSDPPIVNAWSVLVVDGLLLVARPFQRSIDIVRLSAPFV
jgi:hypothetical protein